MGALCRWWQVACTDPTTGKYFRSGDWINKAGEPIEKGGRFVEYNNTGVYLTKQWKQRVLLDEKNELVDECKNLIGYNSSMTDEELKLCLKTTKLQEAAAANAMPIIAVVQLIQLVASIGIGWLLDSIEGNTGAAIGGVVGGVIMGLASFPVADTMMYQTPPARQSSAW